MAGLSRLVMGIYKKKEKKEGCLSDSFRSESSSPGRAISYSWRAIFRGCIMQGRKTAKGSKDRTEQRSHHLHCLEWTGSGGGFTLPGKSTLAFAVILEARNLTCQHETANGVVPSTFREMSNVHFAW